MPLNHYSLNGLRMFHIAVRHLNFRLAAEEMNVTQGAVAQQVRLLEKSLGVQLFQRQPRGLALTPEGNRLHGPVAKGLSLIEAGLQDILTETGQITLSVTPSFAAKWLLPRLPAFQADHPQIDLQIIADQGVATFRADGVDLAIRQGPQPRLSDDLDVRLLGPQRLVAVAARSLTQKTEQTATIGDLQLIEDSHRPWETLIGAGRITRPEWMLKVNQTSLALDAARSGQGVALVPEAYLDLDGKDRDLQVLEEITAPDDTGFYLIWPKRLATLEAHQTVREWLCRSFDV